jgi:hypothetical protein
MLPLFRRCYLAVSAAVMPLFFCHQKPQIVAQVQRLRGRSALKFLTSSENRVAEMPQPWRQMAGGRRLVQGCSTRERNAPESGLNFQAGAKAGSTIWRK